MRAQKPGPILNAVAVYIDSIPRQQLFSLIDSWPGSNQCSAYMDTAFFLKRRFDLLPFVLMKNMYIHQVTVSDQKDIT